ncbi:hypothetical protein E2C01_005186 [Portunus trituberculatus]|uniref:Uncharacterized protein n=1 Tax=Portunus trituberculatus TaxID=210409 RepID=A0A5B7CRV1_PORTR|nr:hypothetical protein [Portunus trituberculatus]
MTRGYILGKQYPLLFLFSFSPLLLYFFFFFFFFFNFFSSFIISSSSSYSRSISQGKQQFITLNHLPAHRPTVSRLPRLVSATPPLHDPATPSGEPRQNIKPPPALPRPALDPLEELSHPALVNGAIIPSRWINYEIRNHISSAAGVAGSTLRSFDHRG